MDLSQDALLKYFYGLQERLESHISVYTKAGRKGKAVMALTVSLSKQVSINIYTIKPGEKNDIKRTLISSAKNLCSVNCFDYQGLPSYDIEFKCTDGKVKRIFTNLIEDKHRFIERLMRVMYLHNIKLFSTVEFNNLPTSINLNDIYTEGTADKNDYDVDKVDEDAGSIDVADYNRYQNLSFAEEENMQKFLNESSEAVINAIEFQETLKQHLLAMEGTNVHSIMSSEKQMLQLMENLDLAIEHVELLESKIEIQDQFLAEVEDSMACLQDRDELVRLTSNNRDQVQAALEKVLYQLTLEEVHISALLQIDLNNPNSVKQARVGADKLRQLLEQPVIEGLDNMAAVKRKTEELNKLADDFARKFATQFNNALMRQVNQQMTISMNNLEKMIELHRSNRSNFNPYVDFMVWLKISRPRSFLDLQKVYIDKMTSVYDQEINTMIDLVKGKLISRDKNISSNTNKTPSHTSLKIQDKLRTKTSSESGSSMTVDSGKFEIIFEDFLCKLKPLVLEEEEFITRLFRLDCRRAAERPDPVNVRPQSVESNSYLINVSNQVFHQLSAQLKTLILLLEQHDASQSLLMVVIVNRQFDEIVRASEFLQITWGTLFIHTKRSFNAYIDRFIASFRDFKAPKKSRCGILPFVVLYASFADQTTLAFQDSTRQNDLVTAHQKIVRDIISQIERVAQESTKTPKEVIIMENHHRMIDILRRMKWPELDELHAELKSKYLEAMDNYVITCVGRPFEKLYIFFENVATAIENGIKAEDIGYQFAFSRLELKKVVREYPGKEVKKGLEHLCKKVEKFVSEDSGLFQVIWVSVQKQFINECLHYESLIEKCYPNTNIKLEFTTSELEQFFREIAASR